MPSSTPRAFAASNRRSHTPSLAQRMNSRAAIHHDRPTMIGKADEKRCFSFSAAKGTARIRAEGLNSAGTARHFAPFVQRQMIASTVRRRSQGSTFACGRQASTRGSNFAHCASVNTAMPQLSIVQAKIGPELRR